MKWFLLCFLIFSESSLAKVEILPFKKFSWDNSWNESISSELEEKAHSAMLGKLDEADLKELGCPGFNSADHEAKKDFWIVFFSALTRAESAFNPMARSKAPKGGHGNYGLLQLSKRTAREQCGLTPEGIAEAHGHLKCGVKLMNWQLSGAPTSSGKLLRPDLKEQLFGKYILLWGPLRQNDKRGRKLLSGWFKQHLNQLSFCTKNEGN